MPRVVRRVPVRRAAVVAVPAFTTGVATGLIVGSAVANSANSNNQNNQNNQNNPKTIQPVQPSPYPPGAVAVKYANGVDGYYFNGAYYTLDGRLVAFEK